MHELTYSEPMNLSSSINLPAINRDLEVKYKWYQQPSFNTFGDFLFSNHHNIMRYCELFWMLIITICVILLWAQHRSPCYPSSTRQHLPVLTALLGHPRQASAQLSPDQLAHNFYFLMSALALINVIFLVATMLILCLIFKRKWLRNALKTDRVAGCEWSNRPLIHEEPYLPTNRNSTAPATYPALKRYNTETGMV